MGQNELPLLNYGTHPVIHARGMAECFAIEDEVHVILFEWTRIEGVFRRVVCGEVIRPVPNFGELAAWHAVSLARRAAMH